MAPLSPSHESARVVFCDVNIPRTQPAVDSEDTLPYFGKRDARDSSTFLQDSELIAQKIRCQLKQKVLALKNMCWGIFLKVFP